MEHLGDVSIDTDEVLFEFWNQKVHLAHIDCGTFWNDGHENVLTDLHLFDEVLVIHHCYLEVATAPQLSELVLKVAVENVDTASQTR